MTNFNKNPIDSKKDGFLANRLKQVAEIIGNTAMLVVGITTAAFAFTETLYDFDDSQTEPFNGPEFE